MLHNRKKKESTCTSVTHGKVTDIVKRRSNKGYSLHPVFEYYVGGLTFVKESFYGSSQPKYAIGQDVKVHYNPDNYNEFYIDGDTLPKTLGKVFTAVGIAALLVAVLSAILVWCSGVNITFEYK